MDIANNHQIHPAGDGGAVNSDWRLSNSKSESKSQVGFFQRFPMNMTRDLPACVLILGKLFFGMPQRR